MGRIQNTVGLSSGIDYGTLIDSLMKLAQRPVDLLTSRNTALKQEQVAVTTLSAYLLAVKYTTDNLGKTELFEKCQATSSNAGALAATVTGSPVPGTYQFTPIRTAQQEQFLSSGVTSKTAPLGGGTLTFRYGDNVQRSTPLDQLNGGSGIQRGKIRITDRSGATATIDLTAVQTIDDVLDAINSSTDINVTASTDGGSIRLTDNTGASDSNLIVREVGSGTTAASLGLAGINSPLSVVDGQDLLKITVDTPLSALNDGRGVQVSTVLPDISYTLRNGHTGEIDFSPLGSGGEQPQQEITVGDILDVINEANPTELKAEIAADGKRIVLTDLTAGGGSFTVQPEYGSTTLAALGLDGAAVGGVITGRQIVGGLTTVLLSSLNGGNGLGSLGSLRLTDRSGATDTVDLSTASTLEDVIDAINAAGVGITAQVNDAKNGISLSDTTGSSTSNMIVEDADVPSEGTAAALGIAADTDEGFVNSGDLHLQVISAATKLSDMNGGAGVAFGKFSITTSGGHTSQINLTQANAQTIGDAIRQINQQSGYVLAKINDTGDGILLVDLEHGSGTFRVTDVDSTTASDLHLTGNSVTGDYGGTPSNLIHGSITQTIQLSSSDSLESLRTKIAALNAGITASTYNDGSSQPYHLALTSQRSGRLGQLVVDASGIDALAFTEATRGRDALLAVGSGGSAGGAVLASATGKFTDAVAGATLEVKQASASPVTVSVTASDADIVANVQTMVTNYNRFRAELDKDTAYDATQDKSSVLTGDTAALQLDTELSRVLTSRYSGAGSIQSLGELGVTMNDDGTLSFDQTVLEAKFADDPQGVQDFFTKEDVGFSATFAQVVEQLSGEDTSLLANRFKSLDRKIAANQSTIDSMNARLTKQRDRLTAQFAQLEAAITKMQSTLTLLDSIQPITLSSNSNTSNSTRSSTSWSTPKTSGS